MPGDMILPPSNYIAPTLAPICLSAPLRQALEHEREARDAERLPYWPRTVVHEAERQMLRLDREFLSPVAQEELQEFIRDLYDALNVIVRNPTSDRSLSVRAGIACGVLLGVPRVVVSQEFQNFCFKNCKFLPAPADLLELANTFTGTWKEEISRVKLIVTRDACKRFTLGAAPPGDGEKSDMSEQSKNFAAQRERDNILSFFPSQRQESRHA